MKTPITKPEAAAILRQKAEALQKKKPAKSSPPHSEAETLKLIHVLEVHQIELEMQNEELVLAKEKAEVEAEKHAALYDFAPAGYFTLSKEGIINELNLCSAKMLGRERLHLTNTALGFYFADDARSTYNDFLTTTFKNRATECCEVTLRAGGNKKAAVAYLTAVASENGEQCFVTMVDITERKKVEEALRESEGNLREAQKLAHIGVWEWNTDTDTVTWTEELYRIAGRDPKFPAPTYKEHYVIYTPKSWELLRTGVERAMAGGESYQFDLELIRPDGTTRHVKVFGGAKFNAQRQAYDLFGTVQDITEHKLAEVALQNSEAKWKSLFSTLPVGVSLLDNNGSIADFNPVLGKILAIDEAGLRNGAYRKRSYVRIDGSPMPNEEFPSARAVKENRVIQNVEIGVKKENGEIVWTKISAAPLNLPGISCVVSTTDITERIHTEKALDDIRDRLELASASAHLGIWDWDIVNNNMVWDDRMFLLYGVTKATSVSGIELWQRGLHPDDLSFAWEECRAALRGEKKFDVEFRVRHPGGAVKWIKADGNVVRDKNGTAVRMIGINYDITERKMAEAKIREKDIQFRKLSANVPDLIFQFTRRPDGSYCVPIASDGIRNIFGCSPEDVLNDFAPIGRVIYPEDAERVIGDIEYSAKHLTYFTCEFRVQIPGRDIQWIYSRSAPEKLEDGSITWYGFNADISDRKKAEEEHLKYEQQLQQNQRLESLGILAGGIAHDFNNLMGGIFGYIDMACDETHENKVASHLSKAMNTIERARALTRQLLTFAKGGDPVMHIGNLFPFVQETAAFALCGANVSCRFNAPKDLWVCNFDKNQIGQVVDNLIINAQQSMPVGGTIELTARNITLAEKEQPSLPKGDYVKISVKDSGIGIPNQLLCKIFDPFFTTKEKGHGLGLATCHSIIRRHGGCIDVESEPGRGSTFKVYLPATTESVSSVNATTDKTHKGSGTFLIMDDEEVMRDTIGDMLESLGYSVERKENGKDAIDFFASETKAKREIAGMIFDLTVPGGMGGKAAIEEIRKMDKYIPAFVASGYADDPVMKNPVAYGFTASICKPFRKSELVEMLERHMKNAP